MALYVKCMLFTTEDLTYYRLLLLLHQMFAQTHAEHDLPCIFSILQMFFGYGK